jgi:NitT/TauT family transport system permease protein
LFVPNPLNVLKNLIELTKNKYIFIHLWYTFRRILIATCISGLTSLPIGLLVYNSKIAKATISPLINLFRYVPVTAFYPLLILWAGIGEKMKIIFYFIATFVYMMPSVVLSLEEINQDLIDTGYTVGMSKLQTITMIQLPSVLPSILNSFIMMFGIGWTYCTVVESINAKWGLGYLIQQSSSRSRTDLVFMAIIVIMIISFVFDNVAKWLIRKTFKWKYTTERCDD